MLNLILFISIFINIVIAQNDPPEFNISALSEIEITDCKNFKSLEGQLRWNEFQKIKHILPKSEMVIDSTGKVLTFVGGTVNLIMTKSQLIDLIGKPSLYEGIYELGIEKNDCKVIFTFGDYDEVLGFMFRNCKNYSK